MMKYLFPIILVFYLVPAKEANIGFVDANRIMTEYQATAAASAEFNEFVNTYRDSAAALKRLIEQLQSESEMQELVLSEDARLRKQAIKQVGNRLKIR